MTHVLVVNTGSSSLKLALLDGADEVVDSVMLDRWTGGDETEDIKAFVNGLPRVDAVGHRIVHGGGTFTGPVRLDDDVRDQIASLAELAPLHQPRGVAGIDAVGTVLPDVPAVACFDTAFHHDLPAAAATYALPRAWNERWSLRRYGFHGLSHAHVARRVAELVGPGLRIVSCHLGSGASLTAIHNGHSVDTTMGFTPLAGLVMATRSGDVDPGLLLWLLNRVDSKELSDALEHRSGLAGLSDGSGDLRDIVGSDDPTAILALDVYLHRLRREIAAMAAAMNGLDVLVFTGGVGEHQPPVRAAAADGLAFLGVRISASANETATKAGDSDITAAGAPVRTLVVPAREDVEIARQVRSVA
ncbi:MAG: acetate/propionate family kinase [Actinophytocola sp.]|uniref:acetate/propionate family kinase n=1 Tax=Actinophytocola sp. TaxID=1872138 RepID=UPI001326DBD0|nr:acetate/propionate family kinase [Actinophytocola sp.]MPZ78969.1 acetate/propionate family kinase [Actinophytocola sp.]